MRAEQQQKCRLTNDSKTFDEKNRFLQREGIKKSLVKQEQ